MNEEVLLIVGITAAVLVVVLVILGIVRSARRRRERERLKDRFGPEYQHAVDTEGSRKAMEDLSSRERERESFTPATVSETLKEGLRRRMAALQYRFVDEPADVLLETQRVVIETLRARGYPVAEDREHALKLLSVDHPQATVTLRAVLEGSYGNDAARMRSLFAETKAALRDVAQLTFGPGDLEPSASITGDLPQPDRPARTEAAPETTRTAQPVGDAPTAGGTSRQPAGLETPEPPHAAERGATVPAPPEER